MTNKIKWFTESRKVSELKSYEKNPRKISEEEKQEIIKSIDGFGRVVPLVINIGSRNNILIGGNQRFKIYKEKKIREVDVMIPSRELSIEEEQELNLRLNKNTASWDYELLQNMDLDLLLDVGFGDDELQDFFDDVELADDDYNVPKALKDIIEPKVKTGEIWQLGRHRLLVGDSTDKESVAKLMNGLKAHVIYQDPPYNIGLDYSKGIGNTNKYGGNFSGKDDSKSDEQYKDFLKESIESAKSISVPDAHFFYWCDAKYIGSLQELYSKQNIDFRRITTWVKNNQNPTPKVAFNKVCELCVYGTTGKPYLNNQFKNANEILNQEVSTGNQLHDELFEMMDLWIVKRDNTQEYLHPTQKPVGLNEKPLKRCSSPGQIIFSGFGGSGSDLIACEQLNRKWYGVEQDLIFATIIIDRWEKFANQKAKKI